jgi:hypothetical protein
MLRNAVAIITLPVLVGAWVNVGHGEHTKSELASTSDVTIYDSNPGHLWNRLHRALYVRTAADGRKFGADRLDPLLWANTRHLLSGKSPEDAVAVLDEFLNHHGEQLIPDPLRRAILQRDLWAVFDWAAYRDGTTEDKEKQSKLLVRLAAAIDRVALTKAQLQSLPDNFAAAVASKSFAARYESTHPRVEFLPPDLLDADGPWVYLKANDGRTITPMHDDGFGGRSVFLVLLRLPEGRKATLDYLAKLRNFQNPWTEVKNGEQTLNPELPQFPAGTEVALVRRAILIDDRGKLIATRLVESIQLRHFHKVPGLHAARAERDERDQDDYEFQLSRKKLFAGEAGGLFSPESDFLFVQFQSMGVDVLERADELHDSGAGELQQLVRNSCSNCHLAPGIFSLRSFQASFPAYGYGRAQLAKSQLKDAARNTVDRKLDQRSWGLLEGLRTAVKAKP